MKLSRIRREMMRAISSSSSSGHNCKCNKFYGREKEKKASTHQASSCYNPSYYLAVFVIFILHLLSQPQAAQSNINYAANQIAQAASILDTYSTTFSNTTNPLELLSSPIINSTFAQNILQTNYDLSNINNKKNLNQNNNIYKSFSQATLISPIVSPKIATGSSQHEQISKNLARLTPKQQSTQATPSSPSLSLFHSPHLSQKDRINNNLNAHRQHQHNHQAANDNQQQQQQKQLQQANSINKQDQQQPISLLTKICIGTSNKLTNQHNRTDHYQNLVDRYKDCTYVIGNLEITWLERGRDLSFLETIREISGYLLIANVEVDRIRLPNLQIIRGRDQYNHDGRDYALFLIDNEHLKTVELPNLTEILAGSYGSYHNKNLCYLNTINWEEILHPPYESYNVYDGTQPSCPQCHTQCPSGCWGEGPDSCQRFTKSSCSCGSQGRCYGASPGDCCHSYCAGGCTGPKETNCLACKNFYDDGTCVAECPSMMRYNSEAFLWEPNPKGKYAFGAFCVKDCPEHLLRDNGACVRTCPANKRSVNGECVSCAGPCPKNCQGVEVVHSGNIDQLINCTVIEGSITISDASFYGSASLSQQHDALSQQTSTSNTTQTATPATTTTQAKLEAETGTDGSSATTVNPNNKYKPMHPNRLEALKNLREITGFLNIQASHPDFKNLSFFRNLMFIGGRQATDYSLSIIKTSLVSLNLHSLRKVKSGKILIEDNKNLCFADTIDWAQTNITRKDEITTRNNAESSKCRQIGMQCHEQCARDGCWGPGPDECLSCNNYKLDDYCVDNCSSTLAQIGLLSYVDGPRICKRCHSECARGCRGTEAKHCFECKNVKDGPFCVPECPSHKYNKRGQCKSCDPSCLDGCTGPSNKLGENGCNSCAKVVVVNSTESNSLQAYCIAAEAPCPDGFYQEYVGPQVEGLLKSSLGKPVCRKCHNRCKSCTGMGTHTSVCVCANYVAGEHCEESCPRDHYEDEQSRRCLKCSPECNGCYGPTEADCHTCRVYRIYTQQQEITTQPNQNGIVIQGYIAPDVTVETSKLISHQPTSTNLMMRFNCTAQCPPDKPRKISDSSMLDPYCSAEDDGVDLENTKKNSLSSPYFLMSLVFFVGILSCFAIRKLQQKEADKTVKLTMHLSGLDDVEPLHPSNLKPNLAPLRSIKETELRKGNILGSGFGGTVYQGYWYPEDVGHAHKKRWPVAIKVLRDNGESNMNKEFLDEAYIMASVDHPNLVRLLAVCMTPTHLMLVTKLMPLGCLLDYVKKNRDQITAKNLFEWCKQIASGMAYLEEHRMVHRDLALRNVLLQTSNRAMVSDFGLAKFLDVDQNEYKSGGGRLPIKWLAPECIRERKFTHKSDVWAFGVTVWELFTFGERPFEHYKTTAQLYKAIEIGDRLGQPNGVTTEVYAVMLACWFYNPDERPSFKRLVENFVKFARDPERYLGCRGKGLDYGLEIDDKETGQDNLDCDENMMLGEEYSSDINDFTEDDSQPSSANAPELTPSTHNRLNEFHTIFGFETKFRNGHNNNNNNIGSESDQQSPSTTTTPLCKSRMNLFPNSPRRLIDEDAFVSKIHNHHSTATIDINNNNSCTSNGNGNHIDHSHIISGNGNCESGHCWPTMHQTMSTNSLAHISDQPTDRYDYLIPSPSTNEPSQFGSFYGSSHDPLKSIPITPSSSSKVTSTLPPHNPPHSAGPIGVNNEEYFLNHARVNYVNYKNKDDDTVNYHNHLTHSIHNDNIQTLHRHNNNHHHHRNRHRHLGRNHVGSVGTIDRLSASNNNIPNSLV